MLVETCRGSAALPSFVWAAAWRANENMICDLGRSTKVRRVLVSCVTARESVFRWRGPRRRGGGCGTASVQLARRVLAFCIMTAVGTVCPHGPAGPLCMPGRAAAQRAAKLHPSSPAGRAGRFGPAGLRRWRRTGGALAARSWRAMVPERHRADARLQLCGAPWPCPWSAAGHPSSLAGCLAVRRGGVARAGRVVHAVPD